jgi:hypothetical protein
LYGVTGRTINSSGVKIACTSSNEPLPSTGALLRALRARGCVAKVQANAGVSAGPLGPLAVLASTWLK